MEAARALREEISRSEAGFLADEARIDRLQLNYDAACKNFAEAARLDPADCWIWIELGDLWRLLGSLGEAEKAFHAALEAAVGSGDERDLSVSHNKIGGVQPRHRAPAGGAGRATRPRSARSETRLAKSWTPEMPGGSATSRSRRSKIGDVQQAQGDRPGALTSYQASLAISRPAGQGGPGQRRLAARPLGLRTTRSATCRCRRATCRRRCRVPGLARDRRALAKRGPGQRRVAARPLGPHNKIGDVLVAQGDLPAALTSYQASLAIAERLAKPDPGNAGWQRDLSVSHDKIGDVQGRRATCRGRWPATRPRSRSPSGWPSGPRQRRVAARPLGLAQQDRRRAVAQGDLPAALTQLPGLARDLRAAGRGGPRQRRVAARPLGLA